METTTFVFFGGGVGVPEITTFIAWTKTRPQLTHHSYHITNPNFYSICSKAQGSHFVTHRYLSVSTDSGSHNGILLAAGSYIKHRNLETSCQTYLIFVVN